MRWLDSITTSSGTNIFEAYKAASNILKGNAVNPSATASAAAAPKPNQVVTMQPHDRAKDASRRLGTIILITDGTVADEREICSYCRGLTDIRTFTFGKRPSHMYL